MEKSPQKGRESVLPEGKSIEELLLSPKEDIEAAANRANVTVEKFKELLMSAVERKNAELEKVIAKKKIPEGIDTRAEKVKIAILEALDEIDLFSLDQERESADVLEDKAFEALNKIEDEKDPQKQRFLSNQAEYYFRESWMSWAGKRINEVIVNDNKSFREALEIIAKEMYQRRERSNVREQADAAGEVARMLRARSYNEEMYKQIEQLRNAFREGKPTPEAEALMRKLTLAARGQFLTSALSRTSLELYGIKTFAPLIRSLGRAYEKAAGFDLGQNNGALGSIEYFELDMPNSYSSQGSPRSRPRRSSIPEERF